MNKLLNFRNDDKCNFVSICAPMVRYSKLPFRLLVREFGCDLAYTPMIIANSFLKSDKARYCEFSTCSSYAADRPLIVQFASRDPSEFLAVSEMVYPYSDGVDLNCGCPQKWAIQDKIGCSLLNESELIADMVKTIKVGLASNVDETHPNGFSVSAKIRICPGKDSTAATVELLRRLDHIGVDWITVHARTIAEKSEPARWEQLGEIVASANVSCGLVVNGDISSLDKAEEAIKITGCHGVMSARGLLTNPALFSPNHISPFSLAKRYIELGSMYGCQFNQMHQHLFWMLEHCLNRPDRSLLHSMSSSAGLVNIVDRLSSCVL